MVSHFRVLDKCGPSEGFSLMNTHSSKNAFFKASTIGTYFTNILILSVAILFSDCWCGTTATMFSQAAQRDSHDLCRFPSWMYFLDGDDNCMLSVPFSTSDLHFNCWQSGANCHAMAVEVFCDAQLRTVVFSLRRMISFLFCLAVLPTCLLHDSRLFGLALRPSAPVCCCHRVSWARGRLALVQEAVRCPPPFLLDRFCT